MTTVRLCVHQRASSSSPESSSAAHDMTHAALVVVKDNGDTRIVAPIPIARTDSSRACWARWRRIRQAVDCRHPPGCSCPRPTSEEEKNTHIPHGRPSTKNTREARDSASEIGHQNRRRRRRQERQERRFACTHGRTMHAHAPLPSTISFLRTTIPCPARSSSS
jgi:hypothetical protein